jgi:hypothetical protein
MRKSGHRLCSLVISTTGAAAILVSCNSGGTPSNLCKAVDSLSAAVTQINQTPLSKSTISAVETSLASVDTAVENLSDVGESDFTKEISAVEAAGTELDKTVSTAVDRPTPANTAAARESMSELTTEVNNLSESTSDDC